MQVENNKVVVLHYALRLGSGELFFSTTAHKPSHIIVGYHQVIPGLENAIMGMKKGDKKSGEIKPKDGYGEINKSLVKTFPRHVIPQNIELKKGHRLIWRKKGGKKVGVVVRSFDETQVVLDLNHPLAGKKLNYKTKIVNIREATKKELEDGMVK